MIMNHDVEPIIRRLASVMPTLGAKFGVVGLGVVGLGVVGLGVVGLGVLGLGCQREQADTAAPEPALSQVAVVYEEPPYEQPLDAEIDSAPAESGTVTIEPSLAAACGIENAEAYFEFDSAELRGAAEPMLEQLATCLTTGPLAGQRLHLTGHADPRGSDAYNLALGRDRAESVATFLRAAGLAETALELESRGEQLAHPDDPSMWATDRRVEIELADTSTP